MKKSLILLLIITLLAFFGGCGNDDDTPDTTPPEEEEEEQDAVTTASIVDKEEDFKAALSSQGTWIICSLNDLTFTEDLVLDGNFINGKKDDKGNDIVQRKIALYTQDEDRKVTARFTLTAPKLTINSPEASIQHGTFVGDLYVNTDNFKLVDQTVDGNIYFSTESAKSTFTMDETSKVTGTQEVSQ